MALGHESFTALATRLQAMLRSLWGAPAEHHRTDGLSSAFLNIGKGDARDRTERDEAQWGTTG